jgi:hypothetical protein
MRFMTAVFSYNRGQLLSNCVRSIERFSPETSVVVFDDRSDDPVTVAELERIAARGHEVIVNDEVSTVEYGNHYANLDRAVQLSRARGYRLLHLVEDDTQFVWHNPRLADEVSTIFDALPDAAQVSPLFWKFASKASGVLVPGRSAYRLRQAPGCVIGFLDVERLAERGFHHLSDGAETTALAAELGLELSAVAHPVVTRVPWPMYTRHRRRMGTSTKTAKPFLVKPLDAHAVHRLTGRDLEIPPYAEHYCVPWGWRCWSPYGWTSSYWAWARGLLIVALRRRSIRGLIPRRVGDMS